MKELRRLAFEGVAYELEDPADEEQRECKEQQAVNENAEHKHRQR